MLERFEQLLKVLPLDEIVDGVIFIELDSIRYNNFMNEMELKVGTVVKEEKTNDIGKAITLNYMGRNFIVTQNKKAKTASDKMYVAFKVMVDNDRVSDNPST